MLITKISNSNCFISRSANSTSVNKNNQISFKGLFGKTDISNYSDSCADITTIYYPYYPFKDESKSEIENQEKKYYGDSKVGVSPFNPLPMQIETNTQLSVNKALPFTKQDFEDYQRGVGSKLKRDIIQQHILENDLDVTPHD